ncbi:hypothetical protein [Niallia sp. FSL M8-0099]|uniref:hypothetical protein n=1 Tax=Niallia sp. FSL M8-0099 TaxID=2954519 RepID=UPI0030F6BEA8
MVSKMKRHTLSEVISYVEELLSNGSASYEMELLYQEFKWQGEYIDSKKHRKLINEIIREMNVYNGF